MCCVFQRAQAAAAPLGSSVPMALDVGKSLSEASLSQKAKCYGRWDCTDARTDCPELADSVHWLLEDAKPSLKGMESLARAGHVCLAAGVTQRGSSYCREASAAPTARLPRVPSSPTSRAARGGDSHPHLSHRFFSSDEQQVRGPCCLPLRGQAQAGLGAVCLGPVKEGRSVCPRELSSQVAGEAQR